MPIALETVVDTASEDIGLKASVAKNLREQIHAAGVQATQEIFETQILPEAKALSPVVTGKNRDSINVSFRDRMETGWISAWLFTESGYGWFPEHGTRRSRAHPYIYPAMRFCVNIAERAREILERL